MGVYRFDNGEFVFQMDYSGKKTVYLLRSKGDGRTVLMRGKEILINDTVLPPIIIRKEIQRIWVDTALETQVNHNRQLNNQPRKTPDILSESRIRDAAKTVFKGVHELRLEHSLTVEQGTKRMIIIRKGYDSVVIRGKKMLLNTSNKSDTDIMTIVNAAMETEQPIPELTEWLVTKIFSK